MPDKQKIRTESLWILVRIFFLPWWLAVRAYEPTRAPPEIRSVAENIGKTPERMIARGQFVRPGGL